MCSGRGTAGQQRPAASASQRAMPAAARPPDTAVAALAAAMAPEAVGLGEAFLPWWGANGVLLARVRQSGGQFSP
jgi:hypothetical protein